MKKPKEYRTEIHTGSYCAAPTEQKGMLRRLFGENAESKYELYFHWYNLIHELGHCVMMFNSDARPHPAEEEQLVNNFAVAYWRHYGELEKLEALTSLVREILPKFASPDPDCAGYMEYAKRNWEQESFFTFNSYGWFQFSSVQAALSQPLSLEQALSEMFPFQGPPFKKKTLVYPLQEGSAAKIVSDAVAILAGNGVLLPKKIPVILTDDVNCHKFFSQRMDS